MWYVMSVDISVFGHLCCVFLCVTVVCFDGIHYGRIHVCLLY